MSECEIGSGSPLQAWNKFSLGTCRMFYGAYREAVTSHRSVIVPRIADVPPAPSILRKGNLGKQYHPLGKNAGRFASGLLPAPVNG